MCMSLRDRERDTLIDTLAEEDDSQSILNLTHLGVDLSYVKKAKKVSDEQKKQAKKKLSGNCYPLTRFTPEIERLVLMAESNELSKIGYKNIDLPSG